MAKSNSSIGDFAPLEDVVVKAPTRKAPAKKPAVKEAPSKSNTVDRWVCTVYATQPSASKVFKFNVPHPTRDTPILFEGRHGIEIPTGLPQFAIDCLENAYSVMMVETTSDERSKQGDVGLSHKQVKVPMYRVDKGKKIENPKPLGKGSC